MPKNTGKKNYPTGSQNKNSSQGGAAAAVAKRDQPNVLSSTLVENSHLANPVVVKPLCEQTRQESLTRAQNRVHPSESGNDSGSGDATQVSLTSDQNIPLLSQSANDLEANGEIHGSLMSAQHGLVLPESANDSGSGDATQVSLTSGQNGVPPHQSGNDSEDDWEKDEQIPINVLNDFQVPPHLRQIDSKSACVVVRQPNFHGPPVSAPPTIPIYLPPELLGRILAILDNSGILPRIVDLSKSAIKHTSTGADKRFVLSGNFESAMVCLLQSIGVPDLHLILLETQTSKTSQFLKSGSQSSDNLASQGLRSFLSLFPNETLSFNELLTGCSWKTSRLDLESSSMTLNLLTTTLTSVQQSERLKVLFQIFCSRIQSRRREPDFTIYRIIFLPFLEIINKEYFLKLKEDSLNSLAIDLIKRARTVLAEIRVLEKQYNDCVDTIQSLLYNMVFSTESTKQSQIGFQTARSESSKASSKLEDINNGFKTDMLVVCSIFRFLNKNSFPKNLFWEILKFVQDTKTMEHIPALCFDTKKECDLAVNVVLSKDAIPSHRSSTSVNSANTGIMSFEECLKSIQGDNRNIINISETGTGKSTGTAMASVFEAVSQSLKGKQTSFVLIGPPNHASDILIQCICLVIQEQISHCMTKPVRIVPVIGMIAPKIVPRAGQITVYVFVINSMNSFPAVTSFFGAQDHKIIVMVDDNEEFGKDLKGGLEMIRKEKLVTVVTMCSASYNPLLFDESDNVLVLGSGTPSLSDLSSSGMIIHQVPLSIGQMKQIWELIHSDRIFFHSNPSFFLEITRIITLVSKTNLDDKKNLSVSLAALSSLYDTLLKSKIVYTLDHKKRMKTEDETEAGFFVKLLSVVLKLLVRMFKSNGVSFQKDVIMKLFQDLVDLDNPDSVSGIKSMDIATLFKTFLIKYITFHQTEIVLPELPKSIIDVSSRQKLDEKFKKLIELLSSLGFCFPDELRFPKPVPQLTDCEYRQACGNNDIGNKTHSLIILGQSSNAILVASDISKSYLKLFGRVDGIPDKKSNDSDDKQSNASGRTTNSSGGSSSSESRNFSFDMTEETTESRTKMLIKYSEQFKIKLSGNAPVPTNSEISAFVKHLVDMNNPMTMTILKNFCLGVFVPTNDMSDQMTSLIVRIFEDGRLCLVIQEGLWNMKSQNFMLSYQIHISCFSEVSFEFFMQNIFGRFGRVGQKISGLVKCFTPSGKIVDDSLSGEDSKCQAQIVPFELLSSNLHFLSPVFCRRLCDFLNGCFTLDSKEVKFVIELMRMSDAAIYDERLKYACYGNDYHTLFLLMSCYLISQYCTLGMTGNVKITSNVEELLKSIAINSESCVFQFLNNESKNSEVRDLFLTAICEVMPDIPDLSTACLLSLSLNSNRCPVLRQRILVNIYFDISKLMKFVDIVLAFLTNLWFSMMFQDQNSEIRAIIAVVGKVKKTFNLLISLISSRVDESHFMKALDTAAMCDSSQSVENPIVVAQNPLEKLKCDLQACSPQTIKAYRLILQAFSKDFPDCAYIFSRFKQECNIFGDNCVVRLELRELKKDQKLSQAGLDQCDAEIAAIRANMDNLTGPLALKTKKRLELNANLKKQNAIRLIIEKNISLIAVHEESLRKYEGMSEQQFLERFLKENFD